MKFSISALCFMLLAKTVICNDLLSTCARIAPETDHSDEQNYDHLLPRTFLENKVTYNRTAYMYNRKIYAGCNEARMIKLNQARKHCALYTAGAAQALDLGDKAMLYWFKYWFNTDEEKYRNIVAINLHKIAEECGSNSAAEPHMLFNCYCECRDTDACIGGRTSSWCQTAFYLRIIAKKCRTKRDDRDLTELMIHEVSHLVLGTIDETYRKEIFRHFPPEKAIRHADNYSHFAGMIGQKCKAKI